MLSELQWLPIPHEPHVNLVGSGPHSQAGSVAVSPGSQQDWKCHLAGSVTRQEAGLGMSPERQQGWQCRLAGSSTWLAMAPGRQHGWQCHLSGSVTWQERGLCWKGGAGGSLFLLPSGNHCSKCPLVVTRVSECPVPQNLLPHPLPWVTQL